MRSIPSIDEDDTRPASSARRSAYARPDWPYLRDQILEAVVEAEVRGTRITPHGVLYHVVVLIDGLNGATHPVATIWLVAAERPPRLVSTWVDVP